MSARSVIVDFMKHRATACVVMVALLGGCSFLVTHNPAAPPADPDCVTGVFPPIVDIFIAVSALVGAGLSHGGGALGEEEVGPEVGFIIGGTAAVGSAVWGFIHTKHCRDGYATYKPVTPLPPPPPGYQPTPFPQ